MRYIKSYIIISIYHYTLYLVPLSSSNTLSRVRSTIATTIYQQAVFYRVVTVNLSDLRFKIFPF